MPTEKSDLAEQRTSWAADRTLLANERTFAGWMRTGLSAVAIGLGFQAIFRAAEPTWLAKLGATGFIGIGVFIYIVALRAALKLRSRVNSDDAEPLRRCHLIAITVLMTAGSLMLAVILWLM